MLYGWGARRLSMLEHEYAGRGNWLAYCQWRLSLLKALHTRWELLQGIQNVLRQPVPCPGWGRGVVWQGASPVGSIPRPDPGSRGWRAASKHPPGPTSVQHSKPNTDYPSYWPDCLLCIIKALQTPWGQCGLNNQRLHGASCSLWEEMEGFLLEGEAGHQGSAYAVEAHRWWV